MAGPSKREASRKSKSRCKNAPAKGELGGAARGRTIGPKGGNPTFEGKKTRQEQGLRGMNVRQHEQQGPRQEWPDRETKKRGTRKTREEGKGSLRKKGGEATPTDKRRHEGRNLKEAKETWTDPRPTSSERRGAERM